MKPTFTFSFKKILFSLLVIGIFLFSQRLNAQVTVDAVSTAATGAGVNATSLTWSHTVGGSDKLLIVTCAADGGTVHTTSKITYGGVVLTKVDAISSGSLTRSEIWYLLNPTSGTADIVWTHSASEGLVGCGISFNGVNQTTPLGTAVTANGTATSSSIGVTAADGDMVVNVISTNGDAVTVGPGQTQRYNVGANGFVAGATSTELEQCPGTTTTNMSWTFAASDPFAHVAVPIKAITGIPPISMTTADAGTTQNLCGLNAGTMAGNALGAGETGLWTSATGVTFTDNTNPTTAFANATVDGETAVWTITNGGCTSSATVTINEGTASTAAAAGTDQTICGPTTATLAGNTVAGHTGVWTLVSGGGTITAPTSATSGLTALATGTNTFRWTLSKTVCTSNGVKTDDVIIKRYDAPTTSAAGPDQIACVDNMAICAPLGRGNTVMAANTPGAGETGAWTKISGASSTLDDASSPTSTVDVFSGTVNWKWTITNTTTGCTSTDDVSITSNTSSALIAGTATASPTLPCTGGVSLLGITGEYSGNIQWQVNVNAGGWSDVAGATSAAYTTGALTNPNSYQYRVKFWAPAPCVNYEYSNTVTIAPTTIPAAGAATNYTFTSTSLTLSTPMGSCAATYTFGQTVPNTNGYINAGVTVTITGFIAGTDATTMTSGSCGGVAINMATVVTTATSVTFTTPAALCGNFTIVLNGITNAPYDAGAGTATVSVTNRSGGTDSGTYPYSVAYHPGDYYDYDAAGVEDYPTQDALSHCYNNLPAGIHCFNYINPASGSVTLGTILHAGTSGCSVSNGGFASVSDISNSNAEAGGTGNQQLYTNSTCVSYPGVATAAGSCLTPGAWYTMCVTIACSGQNFCPLIDCGTGNCGDQALPIELLSFDAKLSGNVVLLNWVTATEINNDYFTVERTLDGKVFFGVTEVDGAGNSEGILQYNSVDLHPFKGLSYYRLKQTDYDGKYAYSRMVPVELLSDSQLKLKYVMPDQNTTTLQYQFSYSGNKALSIEVIDVLGKSLLSDEIGYDKGGQVISMNVSDLSKGVYILKVSDGINVEMKKFIY